MIKAWHFTGDILRDGRPLPANGVWLTHTGDCVMCKSGLHASINPFDALQYAPGAMLCYVECRDIVQTDSDKLVCRGRKIIARMNATDMLCYFSRMQAVSVIHLWEAPDVVCDYLMTGDDSIRDVARAAAWGAACGAFGDAARGAAARDAAWDAARRASWDTAKNEFAQLVYECFKLT